ncbi:MAG: hypothetical protein WCT03_17395 [Candidatus Obscuribacterales bacterium]
MGKLTIVCLFLIAGITAVETAGQYRCSQQPHIPRSPQWDKYGVFAKPTIHTYEMIMYEDLGAQR